MRALTKQRLWQAGICLICLVFVSRELEIAGPTEFRGGYITGPLFRLADWGWASFVVGLLVAIKYQRIASVLFLAAALFCFPMFSYDVFRGYIDKIFHSQSSLPLESNFHWEMWSALTILSLTIALYLSLRNLLARSNQSWM